MAKHVFPAKVVIAVANPAAAFMFSAYAKDSGISDLEEIPVTGFFPFMAYHATITSEWYKTHRSHKSIKIKFND